MVRIPFMGSQPGMWLMEWSVKRDSRLVVRRTTIQEREDRGLQSEIRNRSLVEKFWQ